LDAAELIVCNVALGEAGGEGFHDAELVTFLM